MCVWGGVRCVRNVKITRSGMVIIESTSRRQRDKALKIQTTLVSSVSHSDQQVEKQEG